MTATVVALLATFTLPAHLSVQQSNRSIQYNKPITCFPEKKNVLCLCLPHHATRIVRRPWRQISHTATNQHKRQQGDSE
uniref:Putative secreted protein n=1 Tax=Anopheles marajoara TaxID=58244 RepID=A0A2M4CBY3_9DIPT